MDDERKQPAGRKGPRSGGGKPHGGKPGAGGPKGKRPFAARADGGRASGERREGGKPFVKRDGKPFEKRERKPFTGRPEGGSERPARKPYEKRDGKPFEKRDRKPYAARAEGEGATAERPFRKPYEKREGRPYEKRDGKPFEKRERKPYAARAEGDGTVSERPARKPYEKREGRPFQKRDGKPFAPREGGERERGTAPRERWSERRAEGGGDKPFRKRFEQAAPAAEAEGERIAKRLARAGIASRRDAEELIAAGRVSVNGRVLASPAVNVMPDDAIAVDGTAIPPIERTRLFLFHKPGGVVTTNRDPEGRRTVFDILPGDLPRLMTVGRLDINTEGLLLLTNDGGLARVLELPATGWLRRYRVRVHGKVEEKALAALKDGIAVDGVFYGAIEASLDREQGSNAWLTIGLREGKNREVKNILGALGLDVNRLIRISYGPFQLGELEEGHVMEIKGRMLRDQLGERLIEESGANFEAPVVKPFSNRPVRQERERDEAPRRPREARPERIGEGGLIKKRQRREFGREEALGKLSTRPEPGRESGRERGPRPAGKPGAGGKREKPPLEPPGGRKTNVWMAPGARPQGKGKLDAERAEHEARRAEKKRGSRPPSARAPGRGPRKG